jgi:hypothetical protein
VTRRFFSQRKVRSLEGLPEGDLTFRGETNRNKLFRRYIYKQFALS